MFVAEVAVDREGKAYLAEADRRLPVDTEGAAEVDVALGRDPRVADGKAEGCRDRVEGDASAGDQIMHVSLALGDGQALMGSDRPPGMGTTTFGDSVAISISPDSAEDGRRIFEALADGGMVLMPYEHQFWGADYGMCRDRFGINWMVNYDSRAG